MNKILHSEMSKYLEQTIIMAHSSLKYIPL